MKIKPKPEIIYSYNKKGNYKYLNISKEILNMSSFSNEYLINKYGNIFFDCIFNDYFIFLEHKYKDPYNILLVEDLCKFIKEHISESKKLLEKNIKNKLIIIFSHI